MQSHFISFAQFPLQKADMFQFFKANYALVLADFIFLFVYRFYLLHTLLVDSFKYVSHFLYFKFTSTPKNEFSSRNEH